jgi:hypothetical protein
VEALEAQHPHIVWQQSSSMTAWKRERAKESARFGGISMQKASVGVTVLGRPVRLEKESVENLKFFHFSSITKTFFTFSHSHTFCSPPSRL